MYTMNGYLLIHIYDLYIFFRPLRIVFLSNTVIAFKLNIVIIHYPVQGPKER